MAKSLLFYVKILVFFSPCLAAKACKKDGECPSSQHCCLSHCTSANIQCSRLCFRDQDCSNDHLCHQNICVGCSKRFNCELKACFNDTDCPEDYQCQENNMCSLKMTNNQNTFTLLPFAVIIAVLGFALIILCYTEGCWKELFVYLKRHWGRYGTVALNEFEAEQREGEFETESRQRLPHVHANNKSTVQHSHDENVRNPTYTRNGDVRNSTYLRNGDVRNSTYTRNGDLRNHTFAMRNFPSCSSSEFRNNQCFGSHGRNFVTVISQAIRNQSRDPHETAIVTRTQTNLSSSTETGALPLLGLRHEATVDDNSTESPPSYLSLLNDEITEPPPKYEDVVRLPVQIEMNRINSNGSLRSLRGTTEIETMV